MALTAEDEELMDKMQVEFHRSFSTAEDEELDGHFR